MSESDQLQPSKIFKGEFALLQYLVYFMVPAKLISKNYFSKVRKHIVKYI